MAQVEASYPNQPLQRDQDSPFFLEQLPALSPGMRRVLREYSKLPEDRLEEHLVTSRLKAWNSCPYPCMGLWTFLNLHLKDNAEYDEVVERGVQGAKILDLGCALGQDLRGLATDGVPQSNLFGADYNTGYFDVGHELFNDGGTGITFFQTDILDPHTTLARYYGQFDVVTSNSVQHCFSLEEQAVFARVALRLLKGTPSDLIFGRQVGTRLEPRRQDVGGGLECYRHTPASFAQVWEEAAAAVGRRVRVEARLGDEQSAVSLAVNQKLQSALQSEDVRYLFYAIKFD